MNGGTIEHIKFEILGVYHDYLWCACRFHWSFIYLSLSLFIYLFIYRHPRGHSGHYRGGWVNIKSVLQVLVGNLRCLLVLQWYPGRHCSPQLLQGWENADGPTTKICDRRSCRCCQFLVIYRSAGSIRIVLRKACKIFCTEEKDGRYGGVKKEEEGYGGDFIGGYVPMRWGEEEVGYAGDASSR